MYSQSCKEEIIKKQYIDIHAMLAQHHSLRKHSKFPHEVKINTTNCQKVFWVYNTVRKMYILAYSAILTVEREFLQLTHTN